MILSDDFLAPFKAREDAGETALHEAFGGLGWAVFKRTYAREVEGEGRREEWWETCRRVVEGADAIGAGLTAAESERLFQVMFDVKGLPGGRMLWQLGTENNERLGGDSLVNCWFVDIDSPADFRWLFERLMLGGGVGFSTDNGDLFGMVREIEVVHLPEDPDVDFIVPDNRQGWGEILERVLSLAINHEASGRMTYSTLAVRKAGAPIKTFGGKASGPDILVEGVENIVAVLNARAGGLLRSVDILDIANIIGSIVVSGNVRRSAQIALGVASDPDFMGAKRWDLGPLPHWRGMSNNTVYLEGDCIRDLPESFWDGYRGNGEPYGLFNLNQAQDFGRTGEARPDWTIAGVNPCGEVPLANRESCNLAELFLPRMESLEEMQEVAGLLYKVQKAVAAMTYLDPESDAITSRNMRLGMGLAGVAMASPVQLAWMDPTYRYLRELDEAWSAARGWPESVRLTTMKPGGTLPLVGGVTAGMSPAFAPFIIRRVTMANTDPVLSWCRDRGYPVEAKVRLDGSYDPTSSVVEFPVSFPEGTLMAEEMGALSQLRLHANLQRQWADNAVSVTVYYTPEELPAIREYLERNWAEMKSVSFLLHQGHGFVQAPLEAITEADYLERVAALTEVRSADYGGGMSEVLDDDCEGGSCPVR